jgi:flagellar protein FlaJ
MAVVGFIPLVLAVVLAVLPLVAGYSRRIDRSLTRVARVLFGRYVDIDNRERRRTLEAAYIASTYRSYASKTYLYTAMAALAGGTIGVYLIGGLLLALPAAGTAIQALPSAMVAVLGNPELTPTLSQTEVLLIVGVGGLVGGGLSAGVVYSLRWRLPQGQAEQRRRGINEGLARTTAFLYALSRGGMGFPTVMRTLSKNRKVYGDMADEITVSVREMDLFGTDMISAVRRMGKRTPSEKLRTFSENLGSVLQGGQELPTFLREQYDRMQEEAEERQKEVLELLATIAEAYVTVLVAGVLFLITILIVFGLTTTDTLWLIQMMAYLVIPLANLGFGVYLAQTLESLGATRSAGVPEGSDPVETPNSATDAPQADGGHSTETAANFERLKVYDRFARLQRLLRSPGRSLLERPSRAFYLTVPIALVWIGLNVEQIFGARGLALRAADDVFIIATLFVLGSYALIREIHVRRLRRIEAATPEFLERLASLNEAGMSVVESIRRVRGSDLGALSDEVDRIYRDIQLGANVDEALTRFENRIRTKSVTRATTLLTNAMRASGKIGVVLRIASEQARADLSMQRKRRQEMFTYQVVIYISFFVFLVIIIAVTSVLVASLPDTVPTPDGNRLGVNVDQFARIGTVDKAAYTLVFFHTALVQAVCSGFIAGQMGQGSLKDGAKHATILLVIAYAAFLVLSGPTASIVFEDQTVGEDRMVVVDSVSVSNGGWVVLQTPDGEVVGRSDYLPAGSYQGVQIELEEGAGNVRDLTAVTYFDSDNDESLAIDGDRPYGSEDGPVQDEATIRYGRGSGNSRAPASVTAPAPLAGGAV